MKKRFRKGISLILAVVLVLAMIPAAGAAETETTDAPTYEYVFTMDKLTPASTGKNYPISDAVTVGAKFEDSTLGHSWQPVDALLYQSSVFMTDGYRFSVKGTVATRYPLGKNGSLFKITVGESGYYKPSLSYFKYMYGSKIKVCLTEEPYDSAKTDALKNYIAAVAHGEAESCLVGTFNTYEAKANEFETAVPGDFGVESIYLEKDRDYYLVVSVDGENSTNDYGDAKTYFYYQLKSFTLVGVEAPESESAEPETVSGNVSFVATSNVGENELMTVEAENFTYDELVDTIPAGTYVKVTAPEKEGYEFRHWVRGSRDNGVYVSDEPEYSFTALTHTFLTAIYEDVTNVSDGNTAVVEFYNGNGQYLEKATSTIGGTVALPATAPTLTGFVFANSWETEDGELTADTALTRALTRAVARYNESTATFEVTDHNGAVHNLTYGTEIELASDNEVYWLRDGTAVAYGASYTYAAWDDTVITTSATGEIKPIIVLDADAKDGARMIEYDNGGKNLIEVGIIFGDSADIEIGSCSSKATSQENAAHGQFTAKPNGEEGFARGYLIYEEDGVYKVVYSK